MNFAESSEVMNDFVKCGCVRAAVYNVTAYVLLEENRDFYGLKVNVVRVSVVSYTCCYFRILYE